MTPIPDKLELNYIDTYWPLRHKKKNYKFLGVGTGTGTGYVVRSTVVVNKKGSAKLIDGQRKHLEGTEPGKVRKYVITFRPGPGVGVGVKLVEDVAGGLVIPAAKQEDGVLQAQSQLCLCLHPAGKYDFSLRKKNVRDDHNKCCGAEAVCLLPAPGFFPPTPASASFFHRLRLWEAGAGETHSPAGNPTFCYGTKC